MTPCRNSVRHWFTHRSGDVGGVGVPSPTCVRGCGATNPRFDLRLRAIGWDRAEYDEVMRDRPVA